MSAFPVTQEPENVDGRPITRFGILGVGVALVAVFVAGLLLEAVDGTIRPSLVERAGVVPGSRTISGVEQTQIWVARPGLDDAARGRAALSVWGFVDRDAGLARIPIDRAIDVVVDEARR